MTTQELVMIRKQLGLSQEALAESLGYSRNSVALSCVLFLLLIGVLL